MANFTITKWRCDRCGAVKDKWLKPTSAYGLRASVDYGTAGGEVLNWEQLCLPCNLKVGELVKRLVTEAKEEKSD